MEPEAEDDLDATLPSSQYSERGELLIPSTVLIRREMEEQEEAQCQDLGAGNQMRLQMGRCELETDVKGTMVTIGQNQVLQPNEIDRGKERALMDGNAKDYTDTHVHQCISHHPLATPSSPLPPSSYTFDSPQIHVPQPGTASLMQVPKSESQDGLSCQDELEAGDEFDDPWFDAACMAEADGEEVIDHSPIIGEQEKLLNSSCGATVRQGLAIKGGSGFEKSLGGNKMGGGFSTASGVALPDVSAAAKARIADLFKDEDPDDRPEVPGGGDTTARAQDKVRGQEVDQEEDLFDKMDDSGFDHYSGLGTESVQAEETEGQVDMAAYDPFAEVGGVSEPFGFGAGEADQGGFGFGVGGVGGGFTTAKGKRLAAPSAAAAARALKLFADESALADEIQEPTEPVPSARPSGFSFATAGGDKLAPPSEAAKKSVSALFEDTVEGEAALGTPHHPPSAEERPSVDVAVHTEEAVNQSRRFAFSTAGGSALPTPSKAATDAIEASFSDAEVPATETIATEQTEKRSTRSMFVTAGGSDLVVPSAMAVVGVSALFSQDHLEAEEKDVIGEVTATADSPIVAPVKLSSMFATGNGGALTQVSEQAKARAAAMFAEEIIEPETPKPSRQFALPSSPTVGPLRDTTNTPRKIGFKSPIMSTPKPYSRPDGTPLKHSAGFSGGMTTPVKASSALGKRVGIGLGMTPRVQSSLALRPKFHSPLKKKTEGLEIPLRGSAGRAPSLLGPALRDRKASSTVVRERSCFDLNTRPIRQDMRAAHLHPHYFSINELLELDIPEEIWTLNPTNARYYKFVIDETPKGPAEATADMRDAGCSRVTESWVRQHWTMILWKLASSVRAKPGLFVEKWSYHEIIRQLLYRYEREMNLAHRSAIKRIQEQDSPSSLPMVLCVSSIMLPDPSVDENGTTIVVHPVVELTDGWYRIRANTDATLGRAIQGGRLQVGYKISIVGARLDASREGTEVLEAISKSRLILSGNSTSIAPWDAKLGFVRKPFVASLPSLTKDGGTVALMDVRITKVFPLAYMSAKRGEHAAPWTAAEEFALQDQWKERHSQERTRLTQELQTRIATLEDEVGRVAAASEGLMDGMEADDSVDGEVELEFFRQSANRAAHLRNLPAPSIVELLAALQRDYTYTCEQGIQEIEAEMQRLCPARETRSFQVIRFEDAQVYQKERCRVGQLQVWDAHTLGEGALAEEQRFMVSNLVPAQAHAWCGPRDQGEIFLNSKRDTAWRRLEVT